MIVYMAVFRGLAILSMLTGCFMMLAAITTRTERECRRYAAYTAMFIASGAVIAFVSVVLP